MWVYRLGPERAKRMLFTGDKISGSEAESLGSCSRPSRRKSSMRRDNGTCDWTENRPINPR
jgi:enoyl-CoA hydratase/carnithine racemase